MAIKPAIKYPGRTVPASDAYPLGSARDITTPGDGTGTPLRADWINDIWGFLQALLEEGSVTASGFPDTAQDSQYLREIRRKELFPVFECATTESRIAVNLTELLYPLDTDGGWLVNIYEPGKKSAGDAMSANFTVGYVHASGTYNVNTISTRDCTESHGTDGIIRLQASTYNANMVAVVSRVDPVSP